MPSDAAPGAAPFSMHGKVAIVTGCGSIGPGWGNGKAISVLLARQGASVFGADLDEAAALETARIIDGEGGRCDTMAADVTDPAQVRSLVDACLVRHGRIDVLVNNVGRSEPGGPVELDPETWDDQLDVNLTAAYLMCRTVLPTMVEQRRGAIVNVASVAGLRYIGKPQVAYSAAKAGLIQFSKATAILYADKGIRLNCVVPGLIETPLVTRLADKYAGGDLDGFVTHRNRQVPMARMGTAWDVAHATLFLASDEAGYVTATEIVVDGGFTATTR